MKFRFLGTDSSPKEMTLRGVTFPKGKAVTVDCPDLAAKLDALEFFKRQRKVNASDQDQA